MTKRLSLCGALVLSLAAIVGAQDVPVANEQFRLHFELSRNGTVFARPILRLEAGNTGTIALNDGFTLMLTPSRIDANIVRITCNVEIDDARPRLRIDLRGQEQGSGTLSFGGDFFEIRVALTR